MGSLPNIATLTIPNLTIVLPSYIVATMLTHGSIHRVSTSLRSIIKLEELPRKIHPIKLVNNALIHLIDGHVVVVVVLRLLLTFLVLASVVNGDVYRGGALLTKNLNN